MWGIKFILIIWGTRKKYRGGSGFTQSVDVRPLYTRPWLCNSSPLPFLIIDIYIFQHKISAVNWSQVEKRHRRGSNPWSSVYETDALPLGHCASCDLLISQCFKPNIYRYDIIRERSPDMVGSPYIKTSLSQNGKWKKEWQRWDSNPRLRRDWCLKPAP